MEGNLENRKRVGRGLLSFFQTNKISTIAILVVVGSFAYLLFYFWEPLAANVGYYFKTTVVSNSFVRSIIPLPNPNLAVKKPKSEDFNLTIKKIDVNVPVVVNIPVDDKKEYLYALTKGVAQARGSALPGEKGNIFIFGHSNSPGSENSNYRSVFTLLDKLGKGDEIEIIYKKEKYSYLVVETKTINPDQLEVLEKTQKETVTLMTCWPFGTDLKRLVIRAERE
ncbi:MAG: sortase [Patescibacteria group bacterium]|nr:sortase [Patescibacteria group bacterium]